MRERPGSIWILSSIYCLLGLLQLALQFHRIDYNIGDYSALIPLRETVVALSLIASAIAIWSLKPWGYFLFLTLSSFVTGYYALDYFSSAQNSEPWSLSSIGLLCLTTLYFTQRHVASPYFNPKMRWWDTSPRFLTNLQVQVRIDGEPQTGMICDISLSGVFISGISKVVAGDLLSLQFQYLDIHFACLGKVMRIGKNPPGYGIMFIDLSRPEKAELKRLVQAIRESSALKAA